MDDYQLPPKTAKLHLTKQPRTLDAWMLVDDVNDLDDDGSQSEDDGTDSGSLAVHVSAWQSSIWMIALLVACHAHQNACN